MAAHGGDWCEFGTGRERGEACPICGGKDWCGRSFDDKGVPIVWCARIGSSKAPDGWRFIKQGEKDGHVFVPEGAAPAPESSELKAKRAARAHESEKQKLAAVRAMWKASRPLTDRGLSYFRSRGLPMDTAGAPRLIRFLDECVYNPRDGGPARTLPAILCGILEKSGKRVRAVHRIYLEPNHSSRRLDAKDAKKLKGSPKGGAIRLSDADVAGQELILCEGVETGLACMQATGAIVWACVSTSGLKNVVVPAGKKAPRTIIIAADNDAWDPKSQSHPGVKAAEHCAERMATICRDVRIAIPPAPSNVELSREPGPNHVKSVDWLDVLNRLGASETAMLLRDGDAHEAGDNDDAARGEWRNRPNGRVGVLKDPNDQADELLRRCFKGPGRLPTVRRWNEKWWLWERERWSEITDEELAVRVRSFLRTCDIVDEWEDGKPIEWVHLKVTRSVVAEVINAMMPACLIASNVNMPVWIRRTRNAEDGPIDPRSVVAFENGLLDATAWCEGKRRIVDHQPSWFSQTRLPFSLPDEAAPDCDEEAWARCEAYKPFVERLFDELVDSPRGGVSQIQSWHEWIGYCMTPDTRQQKAMCVQGPPGGGKGTLLSLKRDLVGGEEQVGSTTWSMLGKQFGAEPLVGKLNVHMADASSPRGTDAYSGAELFKMITGNDVVPVGRKTVRNLAGVRMPCRFTIMMNEVVKIPDESGAFQRRLLWLKSPVGEPTDPDPDLPAKLQAELPWIAVLCLNGLMALRMRGFFVQPEQGKRLAAEFRHMASSVLPFVEDMCDRGPELWIEKHALFEAYLKWAEDEGKSYVMDRSTFGRKLLNANLGVRDQRESSGGRTPGYAGLSLKQGVLTS